MTPASSFVNQIRSGRTAWPMKRVSAINAKPPDADGTGAVIKNDGLKGAINRITLQINHAFSLNPTICGIEPKCVVYAFNVASVTFGQFLPANDVNTAASVANDGVGGSHGDHPWGRRTGSGISTLQLAAQDVLLDLRGAERDRLRLFLFGFLFLAAGGAGAPRARR